MRTIGSLLLLFALTGDVFAQNTDPISYHSSRQLSDSTYSLKRANGDSTLFIFQGGNSVESRMMSVNADSTQVIWSGLNQPSDTLEIWGNIGGNSQNLQQVTNKGSVTTNKITAAGINLSRIPTYENQDSAVKHGLVNGDIFKLPKDTKGNRILAVVDTIFPNANFNFSIDNMEGGTMVGFKIANTDSVHFDVTIDWGDGVIKEYKSYAGYIPIHSYSYKSNFNITIIPNNALIPNLLLFSRDFGDNKMYSLSNLSTFSNLKYLTLSSSKLPVTLMDTMTLPSGLDDLVFRGNNFNSYNPISLPSSLLLLDLGQNSLSTLSTSILPGSLRYVALDNNKFTTSVVNDLLVHFDTQGVTGGQLSLIGNTPPAPPSGAGLTAKTNLQAKGWEVTTD